MASPKDDSKHVETVELETITAEPSKFDVSALVKSRYDELSIPRTLWVFKRVVLVTLAVYTGYLCEGFELNAGGSVIANKGFIKQFGDDKSTGVRALDPTWLSTWSALLNVGQLLTFTYVSWFADRFGRKPCFYVAWVWLVVGCVFLNTAKSPSTWALAKLCNGAGIGVLQIVCQVYVMEIVPNRIRGGMVVFQQVWSGIGGIIVAVMMQQLNQKHPYNYLIGMRILWGPIAFMLVCWAFVPESPWFHVRRGEKDKGIAVLKRLYGGIEGYDFEEEYGIIARTIEHEKALNQEKPTYRDVFRGLNFKRARIVIALSFASQLAGLAIIFTYSTYFFSLAGLEDPFLGTLILNCCNLLAVLLWSLSADRIGRRTMVCCCQTLVCVVLFIVGGLYWSGATEKNASAATALLVICCLWTMSFQIVAISYYLFSAELPTALLRIKTGPITFFANSILGIATCYATPPMLLHLSLKTGFVYGAFSVPLCILMWLYVPETKGRSAAEIDELYERKIPAWRWSSTKTVAEEQLEVVVQVKGHVKQV